MNVVMIPVYLLVAYLAGSIPAGYILTKLLSSHDIRDTGSGSTGATNVSRQLGLYYGLLTVVLDVLKGVIPLVIGRYLLSDSVKDEYILCGMAFFSILGHIYPLFLRFRGGKGVATFIGVMLYLLPLETGIFLLLYVILLFIYRYTSLSSILGVASYPGIILLFSSSEKEILPYLILSVLLAIIIIYKHKENLVRLRDKTEPLFSFKWVKKN